MTTSANRSRSKSSSPASARSAAVNRRGRPWFASPTSPSTGHGTEPTRAGQPLSLTRKEFGILELLVAADGRVLSAEELLDRVWDTNIDPFSNIVSVTIARLRRKLGDPALIHTVTGKGYRI